MNVKNLLTRASILACTFPLVVSIASAAVVPNIANIESAMTYPLLPDLPGADISGQTYVVIHLDRDTPLVDVDGQLFVIGDRPLEIEFESRMTLLIVVPEGAGVFVTEGTAWVDALVPSAVSQTLTFDLVDSSLVFGFELADPSQQAPTIPDVIIVPTQSDPHPT